MSWRDDAAKHAAAEYPREACGLVLVVNGREVYRPCINTAEGTDHFSMSSDDWAFAEDDGEIIGLFHSHPDAGPEPSEADRVSCESTGVEWHIIGWPVNRWHSFRPSGYISPLVGREFSHGVLDCYAIVRDYYSREFGIELRNYERHDDWWKHGENHYLEKFGAEGFVEVEDLRSGDLIFMQINSNVPNHAAVYLGDDMILHHLHGRLSSRDVYGGLYRKVTVKVVRHASRNQALR